MATPAPPILSDPASLARLVLLSLSAVITPTPPAKPEANGDPFGKLLGVPDKLDGRPGAADANGIPAALEGEEDNIEDLKALMGVMGGRRMGRGDPAVLGAWLEAEEGRVCGDGSIGEAYAGNPVMDGDGTMELEASDGMDVVRTRGKGGRALIAALAPPPEARLELELACALCCCKAWSRDIDEGEPDDEEGIETCREIGRGRGTLGRSTFARLGLRRASTLGKSIFALRGLSL